MTTTAHTPGPWFLINDHCVGGPIEPGWEEAGCGVAMCGMRARTPAEAHANARLISAAPDLLSAANQIIDSMGPDGIPPSNSAITALIAAYKKAMGHDETVN